MRGKYLSLSICLLGKRMNYTQSWKHCIMMRDAAMLAYASIFHREIGFFLPSDLC